MFALVTSESEPTDRHEEQKDVKVWKNKHSPEEPVHKRQTMTHTLRQRGAAAPVAMDTFQRESEMRKLKQ